MTFIPLIAGWIDAVYLHGEIIGFCPRHTKEFLSHLITEIQGIQPISKNGAIHNGY
ncbi:hypothetical protein [Vibrio harveyi]|uniref:hypothetical protein n=1 Tax=Vibrio harveyi TaxID=669 RepID=UPI000B23B25E|nr:hypothetical protein [Vibrio harveyi]